MRWPAHQLNTRIRLAGKPMAAGFSLLIASLFSVISRNILTKGGFSEVTEPPPTGDGPTPELRREVNSVFGKTLRLPEQGEQLRVLERPAHEKLVPLGAPPRPAHKELVPLEAPPPKDILQLRPGGSAWKDRSKTARSDEI